MSKYIIVSTIRFLDVADSIDGSFSLMPGIELITERKGIKKIVDKEFRNVAGIIEYDHFRGAKNILYCDANESIFSAKGDSHLALTVWLMWLEMLLKDSWLIKDNSMVCESAYCKAITGSQTAWTSNNLESSYSISSGEKHKNTSFSLEELKSWERISYKVQSYLHTNNSSITNSFVEKSYSRIGRAFRFVTAARKDAHPAIKIVHYCSALESIFSTDNAELSHKLSERVALFLDSHSYNAQDTFDKVKSFYNIRSKVTHGDSLKQQTDVLSLISADCDNLLRSIMNIILSNDLYMKLFDGQKGQLEAYFKDKLLGG